MSKSWRTLGMMLLTTLAGLLSQRGEPLPEIQQPAIISGQAEIAFQSGELTASTPVEFPVGTFSGQPVMGIRGGRRSECIAVATAEHIEGDGFLLSAKRHDASMDKRYRCKIEWIAIGKPAARSR